MQVLTTTCVVGVHASQASAQNWKWAFCQLHGSNTVNAQQQHQVTVVEVDLPPDLLGISKPVQGPPLMQCEAYLVYGLLVQVGNDKQREVRLTLHLHKRKLDSLSLCF